MTHDYIRNGTTTLFAALNVLDGTIVSQCMQRHRHQEFLRFLNRLERDFPAVDGSCRRSRGPEPIAASCVAEASIFRPILRSLVPIWYLKD